MHSHLPALQKYVFLNYWPLTSQQRANPRERESEPREGERGLRNCKKIYIAVCDSLGSGSS